MTIKPIRSDDDLRAASELATGGVFVSQKYALASKRILYFLKLKFRILRIVNVKDHACHAGLDPASMNSESWIADQVRNDSFFYVSSVA